MFRITVTEKKTTVYEVPMPVDSNLSDQENCELVADVFSGFTPRTRAKYKLEEVDTYWGCEAELLEKVFRQGQKLIQRTTGHNYAITSIEGNHYELQPEDPTCPKLNITQDALDREFETAPLE
jgi:hypothetical protein